MRGEEGEGVRGGLGKKKKREREKGREKKRMVKEEVAVFVYVLRA